MDSLLNALAGVVVVLAIAWVCYAIPYFIHKGWNDAGNKTKKVCDVCFRDINKWNEFVKKNGDEYGK